MPEGRMLKKKITYDSKVVKLSLKAKFIFTWLIPFLDAEGRMLASPDYIKGNVLLYVNEIKKNDILACLNEMAEQKLISIYGDNVLYLQFNGFFKNQKVRKGYEAPSNIPSLKEIQSNYGSNYSSNSGISKVKESKVKESIYSPPSLATFGKYVKINKEDYKHLCKCYSKEIIDDYIDRINDYIASKSKKPYTDYTATLRNWLRKDQVPKKEIHKPMTEEDYKNSLKGIV